jgi:hypothetical protein
VQIHAVLHLDKLSQPAVALDQIVWRVTPHNVAILKGNRDRLGNDRGGGVKKAGDYYKVPFKRALMLRSPCAQWLEADDMRALTQMVLRYAHLPPEKLSFVAGRIERQALVLVDEASQSANVAKNATFSLRSVNRGEGVRA